MVLDVTQWWDNSSSAITTSLPRLKVTQRWEVDFFLCFLKLVLTLVASKYELLYVYE